MNGRCVFIVLAIETGGRWGEDAVKFIEDLAFARARDIPRVMRWSATLAWRRWWTRLLSIACAQAFANSLVLPEGDVNSVACDGGTPELSDVLADGRA